MKTLILFLLFVPTCVYSQEPDQKNEEKNQREIGFHEINIGLTDLFNREIVQIYQAGPYGYANTVDVQTIGYRPSGIYEMSSTGLGIGYKAHFTSTHAARIQLSYNYTNQIFTSKNINSNSGYTANSLNESNVKGFNIEFRPGYEYSFQLGNKFQGFTGIEFVYQIEQYDMKTKSTNEFSDFNYGIQTTVYESNATNESYAVGISPFVGIRYFLNKSISLSLESKFDAVQVNSKIISTYKNPAESTSETKSSEFVLKNSPLGFFSINMHF